MTTTSAPPAPTIDKEALKRKYREERDKRLRRDGIAQYRRVTGDLAQDPYMPVIPREPKRDHVTFTFIGGGFAGLVTGARLREAGVDDVRIVDKAGDFGGTWYWNRYPGAQCDTASFVYMPLLEETGHMPTEKYARAPEILGHCRRIGEQFGLYDKALFHTEVSDLEWDDRRDVWIVRTNRGDEFTTQFLGMGTGPLHVAKLPDIAGIESFRGHSFHTSRWDYGYTGGDPDGAPMENLADKRVAVIGTGATGIQCIPHLARDAGELFVFQRTPSSVDVRNNTPTDPEWFAQIATPGWQKRWLENFTANTMGAMGMGNDEDLVMDGWTDLARRVKANIFEAMSKGDGFSVDTLMEAFEDADFEKMEEIRARAESVVEDPETANNLKAWYRQLCKRPCFHDEYLQSYNRPTVHLVHTDGKGVERVTEKGLVALGKEYEVDCIIYATGFEVGTGYTSRAGYDPRGRDGLKLSDYWAEGMRTMHGIHVHNFPNMFIVQLTQGSNHIANVPHNLSESGTTIAAIVQHAADHGHRVVEVTAEAEEAWLQLLLSGNPLTQLLGRRGDSADEEEGGGGGFGGIFGALECTPGYYNNEGQKPARAQRYDFLGYPGGPLGFFSYIDQWRASGSFEGLAFT
jgi:cation diffusion facilitator CzcD-associated flavoprotein CzcO